MGHLSEPNSGNLIISAVDRTNAINSGAGMIPDAQHVILLGENAGNELKGSNVIAFGELAAGGAGAGWGNISTVPDLNGIVIGERSGQFLNGDDTHDITVIGHDVQPGNATTFASIIANGAVLDDSEGGNPFNMSGSLLHAAGKVTYTGAAAQWNNSILMLSNKDGFDLASLFPFDETTSNQIRLQTARSYIAHTVDQFLTGDLDSWSFTASAAGITELGDVDIEILSDVSITPGTSFTVDDNAQVDIHGDVTIPTGSKIAVVETGNIAYMVVTKVGTGFTRFGFTGSGVGLGTVSGNAAFNAAGASVGTLTNAPTAGNPTKWLVFDDNGTPLKIPAWV